MNDNRLIAEFMGAAGTPKYNPTEWDVYITGCLDVDSDDENAQHFYTLDEMKYHTSWNWLMPVVDKINDYTNDKGYAVYSVEIDPNHVTIRRGLHTAIVVDRPQADSYMEMIYLAVVEFAKRYHQFGYRL